MVSRSVLEPGQYTGFYPLAKNAEWEKSAAIVRNLASMREKIRALEKQIKTLTDNRTKMTTETNDRIEDPRHQPDQGIPAAPLSAAAGRPRGDYELGKTITAIKNVTVNEEFFNGHFPHKPVMPGVLMIEALAQTAAILSFMTMGVKPDENSVVYFVGIDNARFKRPVGPATS
jgi:hypothetical protein